MKIFKIFSKFPTNCVFRPNVRKINAWFVKLFERFRNFLKKTFEKFRNFSDNFQQIFFQARKNLTHDLLNFLKNMLTKSIFSNFPSKNFSASQNFATICVFRPTERKVNAWFVKSFENMLKNAFSQFS